MPGSDLAYDRLPVTVIRFDRGFRFLFVNRRYCEQVGQSADELIGRTLADLRLPVPAESKTAFAAAAVRVFDTAQSDECAFHLDLPTGRRTIHALLIPELGPDGSAASVLSVGTDVTELEEAQAARRSTEQLFGRFMDHLPINAWLKDADGRYVFVNRSTEEAFRRPLPEWVGRTDDDLFPADVAAPIRRNDRAVLESGEAIRVQETATSPDGPVRTYLSIKFPVTAADGRRLVGGAAVDLTERKRLEDEKREAARMLHAQKLESLGVLAGGIAHDFNNLLTGILGYASMARLELDGLPGGASTAAAHLQQIERGAMRAADLCKQMLAYAGKGQVSARPTDLNRLVEEMTALLALSISKKAVLRFSLTPRLPAVQYDPTQLRQVVMNLITNASDAIGDRSGLITIGSGLIDADALYLTEIGEPHLPPARYVYLEVSDTGCGMSEETKARIFEPFYTTKFAGRGLGLSAVAGIVRSHHGAIKVYSQVGKGTTFKVLMPAADEAAAADAPPAADRRAFGRGRRVLVVEDEEDIRVLVRKVLTAAGFAVDVAEDGVIGVEAYRRSPDGYALVLMDLTMPHLDGVGVYRELRQIRKDVTAVLMSGFAEGDATAGFEGKGLAGFVRKPFSVTDLLTAVHAAVGP